VRPRYSAEAARDLSDIERYYDERASAEAARGFVERILDTLERLIARNPRVGRPRPERGPETRSFPVLPYVVFYRINRRRIEILRILHGHRDIRPPLISLLVAA
jgi:toxin ParE1/3/4